DIPFFPWHKNQLLLMPQNTTFFSRGETPTFVNYVIAHNKARPPAKSAVDHMLCGAPGLRPLRFVLIQNQFAKLIAIGR
ncbi:MAG: hypothetical protein MR515_00815, partial [Acidaminococcus fermentans]|uniref:hypothetical protein n=1 Tax=Acidaminococcus fermentans TaxID=905 RepID=UPI00242A5A53